MSEFELVLRRKEDDGQYTELYSYAFSPLRTLPAATLLHMVDQLHLMALTANKRLLVPILDAQAPPMTLCTSCKQLRRAETVIDGECVDCRH